MTTQNNIKSPLHFNLQNKTYRQNYQPLGYILYDASSSPWVTFSYELTGPPDAYGCRSQ